MASPAWRAWPAASQAFAQPVADLEPDAAAVAPADEADEAELTADDIAADAEAEANGRPTHAEIKERLRIERALVQGRRPGAVPAPFAAVNAESSQPTQALAEQHQRVLTTRHTDAPPEALFLNPDAPPRMDAGDPNPDRIRPPDAEAAQ
ncbi:MAG: hypothetical protein U0587_20350 [Candidatus Binatia bacterium]